MKKVLAVSLFALATLAWAGAQQQGSSPSSPGTSQTQPSTPGAADQGASSEGAASAPVTEGCLGGSNPNYTIMDKSGTNYKLNLPPNADGSRLASHIGESVQVQGDVKDSGKTGSPSINVQRIAKGTGNCPASGSTATQPPSKQ